MVTFTKFSTIRSAILRSTRPWRQLGRGLIHNLIHSKPQGWAIWAALAGLELPASPEQPFAHLHFAIDAAIAGLGSAVMPWPLVADYVRNGRLVAPLGFRRTESAFAMLAAPGAGGRGLEIFRKWLIDEGARTAPAPLSP